MDWLHIEWVLSPMWIRFRNPSQLKTYKVKARFELHLQEEMETIIQKFSRLMDCECVAILASEWRNGSGAQGLVSPATDSWAALRWSAHSALGKVLIRSARRVTVSEAVSDLLLKPSAYLGLSEPESELLCNWRSVSQSVLALSPCWTHDHILVVVKTFAFLFVMGRSPCRKDGSIM
jgi:hypothetical protein